ncbi:sulfatase family protein [Pedobacter immunditicola]|uniref:sulfatase family protein n=1 Tax=Pedobacter immunditicola TaxID=3133440 RepID=UPI0030997E42
MTKTRRKNILSLFFAAIALSVSAQQKPTADRPNVIFIYADDLGYGDLGSYGATKIKTPHLDRLAASGIRFTDGRSTSATCTPSRYALMTGEYPWRRQGTSILPGDAVLIIPTDKTTLPKVFKNAGYKTAIVGKWHLGLGTSVAKNWNADIKPGPNEVGFDYSYIFPATADRVPTVFMENHSVVGLDENDPITVDYAKKIGKEPTGLENPELLKMKSSPNHGHNNTIVNGIGRIGFMTGGQLTRWVDEEVATTFLYKAQQFIEENQQQPFFLFFSLTEPHVPRMPATPFKGKSGLGLRGDAILQLDWTVGEIMKQLKHLGMEENTMVIFSSDNGPVLDDGYEDEAVTKLNGHLPAGILRGGKYSMFEAGTRVPFIVSWPGKIKPQVSDALVSQLDFVASFAKMLQQPIPKGEAPDSEDLSAAFLGHAGEGRSVFIAQGAGLAIIKDGWKYIPVNKGLAINKLVNIETGNSPEPQLYDLKNDLGEKNNLAAKFPKKVKELANLLASEQKRNKKE